MDSVERGEIPLEVAQLKLFDEIESKTGSHGPKLYHAECYDGSHYDSGDKEKYLNKKEESNGQNK